VSGDAIRSRLIFGDCLRGLPEIQAASVDLVFADLPYGRTQNNWDHLVPISDLWAQLRRVCRPDTPMVFTAIQPFTSLLVCSNLDSFRYEMIWRKNKARGFLNAKKQPLRAHENVVVFYDKQPRYEAQMTDGHEPIHWAKTSSRSKNYGQYGATVTNGGTTKRYPTSVLDVPVVNNDDPERIHTTQKPVALVEWFIRTYTDPGGVVLDPTAGSATTLVAAERLGRTGIGFEADQRLFDLASARLRAT